MDNKEIEALIKLIDDPDPAIHSAIQQKLLDSGEEIIPQLEKAWEEAFDSRLQNKLENIIQKIQFNSTLNRLLDWKKKGAEDLLYGAYLIARYQYPDLHFENIEEKIESIKKDIWLELNNNLTALEKVKIINHILFDIQGIKRNSSNFYSPQNYYINNVLETKKGNPVTLALIYTSVAQRLGLPIYGINLPKNFILAYKDEVYLNEADDEESILFYINPYNKGAVFGRKEINHFIKQQKLEDKNSYYVPCSNLEIIKRLIHSLIETYENLGYPNKIKDLKKLNTSLD